jgi:hypothetical protein
MTVLPTRKTTQYISYLWVFPVRSAVGNNNVTKTDKLRFKYVWSLDGSVGAATRLRTGHPGNRGSILDRAKN